MSEHEEKPSNRRLHLVFALAVLVGAIIVLLALEFGALGGGSAPQPPATEQAPPATGG